MCNLSRLNLVESLGSFGISKVRVNRMVDMQKEDLPGHIRGILAPFVHQIAGNNNADDLIARLEKRGETILELCLNNTRSVDHKVAVAFVATLNEVIQGLPRIKGKAKAIQIMEQLHRRTLLGAFLRSFGLEDLDQIVTSQPRGAASVLRSKYGDSIKSVVTDQSPGTPLTLRVSTAHDSFQELISLDPTSAEVKTAKAAARLVRTNVKELPAGTLGMGAMKSVLQDMCR